MKLRSKEELENGQYMDIPIDFTCTGMFFNILNFLCAIFAIYFAFKALVLHVNVYWLVSVGLVLIPIAIQPLIEYLIKCETFIEK